MSNSSVNLVIPTGLFRFNATLPSSAPEKPESYTIDFGEFEKGAIKLGGDVKKNFNAVAGTLGLDAIRRVKTELSYEFMVKYLSPAMLAYFMGSASGSAPLPGKIVDGYGFMAMQAEGEPIVPTGNTNEADGILVHHSFACGLQFEGDLTMNGDEFANLKLTVNVYLGKARGIWKGAARPVTPVPVAP